MRIIATVLCVWATSSLCAGAVLGAEETAPARPYPDEVALTEVQPGQWTFNKFPEGYSLYVFAEDADGQSHCRAECAVAWPPLEVSESAAPVGLWTIIDRNDGSRQWAYKDQPVYMRYHDMPLNEKIQQEGWHLIEP